MRQVTYGKKAHDIMQLRLFSERIEQIDDPGELFRLFSGVRYDFPIELIRFRRIGISGKIPPGNHTAALQQRIFLPEFLLRSGSAPLQGCKAADHVGFLTGQCTTFPTPRPAKNFFRRK